MPNNDVTNLKNSANAELKEIGETLKKNVPGVFEAISSAVGATGGGAISLTTLSSLSTSGLSVTYVELKRNVPGWSEAIFTVLGASGGGTISLLTLSKLGVSGLSASGITSGLATTGAVVGGGMVAGMAVLAVPILTLGVTGYAIARNRKDAKKLAEMNIAINKLYEIQKQLQSNSEYFEEQLAGMNVLLDMLEVARTEKEEK